MTRTLLCCVLLSAASCASPGACETSAQCDADDASRGFVCVASACEPCVDDGDCTDGYGPSATCEDGRCVVAGCTPGDEGCSCGEGDACDTELVCAGGTCTVQTGCEGCPCGARCDGDLVCDAGTCVRPPGCTPGTAGCMCATGGSCDGGLTCDAATSLCGPCTPGTSMCECAAGGACNGGLACEASPMCPAGATQCCVPMGCDAGSVGCTCRTTDPACGPGSVCRGGLCVCGENFTGDSCEIACTDTQLLVSEDPVFNPAADQGFWLCGHFAASEDVEVSGGTFTLRGEIPITATDGAELRGGTFSVLSR